jgi:hypothetical protein
MRRSPLRSLINPLHVEMLLEDRGVAGNRSPGRKTRRRFSKRSHRAVPREIVGRSVVFVGQKRTGASDIVPPGEGSSPSPITNEMARSHQGSSSPAVSSTNNSKPGSGHPTSRSADGGGVESRGFTVSAGRLVVLKASVRTAIGTLTSVLRIPPMATPVREDSKTNNSDNSD